MSLGRRLWIFALAAALAASGIHAEQLTDLLPEAEKQVVAIRGREFRRPVQAETIDIDALRRELRSKFEQGLPCSPGDYFRSLAALGAIDKTAGLEDKLLAFYASQVLAFYDPMTGRFYVVRGAEQHAAADFELDVMLVHELTHALQDQYIDLAPLVKSLRDNSDRALAVESVLEGEATLVMIDAMVQSAGGSELSDLEQQMAPLMTSSMADLAEAPADIPPFFAEQLIFPYAAGTDFIRARKAKGGWGAIDRIWSSLPSTTATILHPDRPARFETVADPSSPAAGTRLLYSDTLGEWTLRFLLRRKIPETDADRAAALWRGDRFSFYDTGSAVIVVGTIRTDSDSDAALLAAAWNRLGRGRAASSGRSVSITIE
jgi:hypothetical protein